MTEQDDALMELHYSIAGALKRCLHGYADEGDVRLLCYACGVDPAELGLPLQHTAEPEADLDMSMNTNF